jgi:aldose 1-epimerase
MSRTSSYPALFILAAGAAGPPAGGAVPQPVPWGTSPKGEAIVLYTLTNAHGMTARVTNFGGILVSLLVPGRDGKLADVVLGFDTFEQYLNTKRYYGATVGRYANRIGHAKFQLDGKTYTLAKNNGENSLHGGIHGFHKAVWKHRGIAPESVEFSYHSPDGEEGFPGNMDVTVRYTVTPDNQLRIEYSATTDKDTVVNFTNHSFFNLAGEGSGSIVRHVAQIDASRFTPVDSGLIPTGELRPVAGTPFDFRKPIPIGTHIDADDPEIKLATGYDHNWVLDHYHAGQKEPAVAATVYEPDSGRTMEVLTTEPGMQFFTTNTLEDTGKQGHRYGPRSAFCMETQHFPDSPNRPEFPTTVLHPGQQFHSTTIYRFSVR